MASIEEKEIAKDIIISLIEEDALTFEENPDCQTYLEMVCKSYIKVVKTLENL